MSLFKRIQNIFAKPEPPVQEKSILTVGPSDVVEVSLVTYQVTGKAQNHSRKATMLTLQDGNTIRYLYIEERERTIFHLYSVIDGRLESVEEVPSTIEMDDISYHLEEQYTGRINVVGKTPFQASGEQYIWQFQSDGRQLLRIEWQDGRFMLYEGEPVLPADVQVLRGT
ncbi:MULTISPECIES: DUF4178 domain-containing protein [Brevibacillus]|uniref:DUF4178 domain-containing protein n=1 Tax=Brevibacillus centrosporus TaxID=54910 RepID=A0A1I3SZW0_9BACL|nr:MULTISPECIES: DUF4178 domain-containing protein [Brevibacillus]MDR7318617.1 hypothetical protein [Brevibacillus nitrificans]MEC2128202.1 DUF4178 domain-containing protein [Brevibacillus centrosporus]MED4909623.1 DUF4178 domain-containing protein [Brevibacillus centrosporus]RNB73938.1 DUF4178 domain-containing protein [Brevibacillus centrosporus]SFJ63933.1 protein of unknown function [Brevibacillus centrosporus]